MCHCNQSTAQFCILIPYLLLFHRILKMWLLLFPSSDYFLGDFRKVHFSSSIVSAALWVSLRLCLRCAVRFGVLLLTNGLGVGARLTLFPLAFQAWLLVLPEHPPSHLVFSLCSHSPQPHTASSVPLPPRRGQASACSWLLPGPSWLDAEVPSSPSPSHLP